MIMLIKRNDNSYLFLVFALLFFISAVVIHSQFDKPVIEVSKQESATNLNQDFLSLISLGNQRLISNGLWIQTLMESDLDHYSQKNLDNWMYLRFRTISTLDPKFYENYLYGGIYLSIVKDDVEGASDIFERGLKFYPKDFKLNYNAGFNYYFEMGDYEKGLEKLSVVENDPQAPDTLKYIINKLRHETGASYESTMGFLLRNYEIYTDPVIRKKLTSDIYALKAEHDLECLNANLADCATHDAEGNLYLKKNGRWEAQREFKPYKIFRR